VARDGSAPIPVVCGAAVEALNSTHNSRLSKLRIPTEVARDSGMMSPGIPI
jgi:hypothetical protein